MVEEMLAARGVDVSHESVRNWAKKFGREFSNAFAAAHRLAATNGF